jgi:hypothetical protein
MGFDLKSCVDGGFLLDKGWEAPITIDLQNLQLPSLMKDLGFGFAMNECCLELENELGGIFDAINALKALLSGGLGIGLGVGFNGGINLDAGLKVANCLDIGVRLGADLKNVGASLGISIKMTCDIFGKLGDILLKLTNCFTDCNFSSGYIDEIHALAVHFSDPFNSINPQYLGRYVNLKKVQAEINRVDYTEQDLTQYSPAQYVQGSGVGTGGIIPEDKQSQAALNLLDNRKLDDKPELIDPQDATAEATSEGFNAVSTNSATASDGFLSEYPKTVKTASQKLAENPATKKVIPIKDPISITTTDDNGVLVSFLAERSDFPQVPADQTAAYIDKNTQQVQELPDELQALLNLVAKSSPQPGRDTSYITPLTPESVTTTSATVTDSTQQQQAKEIATLDSLKRLMVARRIIPTSQVEFVNLAKEIGVDPYSLNISYEKISSTMANLQTPLAKIVVDITKSLEKKTSFKIYGGTAKGVTSAESLAITAQQTKLVQDRISEIEGKCN